MSKFDDFFKLLKENLGDLFKESWEDVFDAVQEMGEDFLVTIKDDLDEWTRGLVDKKLTKEEFEFLLGSKTDLMKLKLLTDAGLTKVRIDKLKDAIINVTVKTALDVFLK